ncbi:hypothetical protein C1645_739594 [Glomus cerebriforme]|uniref:Uncharacterized protein n=1 Tax=Glomus cerebriforme TaxID=658196 RepID=A0A397SVY8_9GLOM|nr:hypothetical protein C1645_739594 [Glomus cerebriforme]
MQTQTHTTKATEETDIVTDFVQNLLQELLSPGSQDPETIKFSSPATLSASVRLKKLANLFYQANNAKNAIKAKRTEISSWYCYSERFEDKVMELRSEDKKLTDQTARKRIYNEMKSFLTGVSDGYLRVMTCKARKINKLFGYEYDSETLKKFNGIGWDMIHRVTCSADSISRLTNPQIKYIIDQVNSKTINNVNDQSHVSEDNASQFTSTQAEERTEEVERAEEEYLASLGIIEPPVRHSGDEAQTVSAELNPKSKRIEYGMMKGVTVEMMTHMMMAENTRACTVSETEHVTEISANIVRQNHMISASTQATANNLVKRLLGKNCRKMRGDLGVNHRD